MEIVGYTISDLAIAIDAIDATLGEGESARLRLCTTRLPTDIELANFVVAVHDAGGKTSFPTTRIAGNVAVTEMILTKGNPLVLAPIVTLATIGLIAFGIMKAGEISSAVMPLLLAAGGLLLLGIVILAPKAERVATKYVEAGGKLKYLPSVEVMPATSEKKTWGPPETADPEVKELWRIAVKETEAKYPIGHPNLVNEAKRAGVSQEETQKIIAHEIYLERRQVLLEKWAREHGLEKELRARDREEEEDLLDSQAATVDFETRRASATKKLAEWFVERVKETDKFPVLTFEVVEGIVRSYIDRKELIDFAEWFLSPEGVQLFKQELRVAAVIHNLVNFNPDNLPICHLLDTKIKYVIIYDQGGTELVEGSIESLESFEAFNKQAISMGVKPAKGHEVPEGYKPDDFGGQYKPGEFLYMPEVPAEKVAPAPEVASTEISLAPSEVEILNWAIGGAEDYWDSEDFTQGRKGVKPLVRGNTLLIPDSELTSDYIDDLVDRMEQYQDMARGELSWESGTGKPGPENMKIMAQIRSAKSIAKKLELRTSIQVEKPAIPKAEANPITGDLTKSIVEEREAESAYMQRGITARELGDYGTQELYRHVAAEESHHAEKFAKRLSELDSAALEFIPAGVPPTHGRVDWMSQKKVWRVIGYKGAKDVPMGDYSTKQEAEDKLRELVKEKHLSTEPSVPNPKEELEFIPDPLEYLTQTLEISGWSGKLDDAFQTAIKRVRGTV